MAEDGRRKWDRDRKEWERHPLRFMPLNQVYAIAPHTAPFYKADILCLILLKFCLHYTCTKYVLALIHGGPKN